MQPPRRFRHTGQYLGVTQHSYRSSVPVTYLTVGLGDVVHVDPEHLVPAKKRMRLERGIVMLSIYSYLSVVLEASEKWLTEEIKGDREGRRRRRMRRGGRKKGRRE